MHILIYCVVTIHYEELKRVSFKELLKNFRAVVYASSLIEFDRSSSELEFSRVILEKFLRQFEHSTLLK